MSQLQTLGFGTGLLFATPAGGNQPTSPTPVQIGVLQNVKLTFSGDIKTLKGQLQYPVDSAVGNRDIKGSFSSAQMSLIAWNNLIFGESATTTGGLSLSYTEPHAVPTATSYAVTVTPPGSGTWSQDGGVTYAATGIALTAVASAPSVGEYMVSAGVYTFAAADEGAAVLINYFYTTTTGQTLTINNHTMGWGPIVSLVLTMPYQGDGNIIQLYSVRISKLDLSTKQDDYTMADSDFQAFANPAGQVGKVYLPN